MNIKKLFVVLILITILAVLITSILIVKHNTDYRMYVNNKTLNGQVKTTPAISRPVTTDVELYLTYHRNVKDNASGMTKNFYYDTNPLKWDIKI